MRPQEDTEVSQKGQVEPEESARSSGVRCRAVVLGLVFLVAIVVYNLRVQFTGSRPSLESSMPPSLSALAVLAFLRLTIALLERFGGKKEFLSRKDLATVYSIMYMGGFIGTAIVGFLIPMILQVAYGYFYYPRTYKSIYESMSPLIIPKSQDAMIGAMVGMNRTKLTGIPWSEWIMPLILWSSLILAVVWTLTCIGIFIRRQLTDVEHLRYPLTAAVAAVATNQMSQAGVKSLAKDKLAWLGAGLSVFLTAWRYFGHYFAIPVFPTEIYLSPIIANYNQWLGNGSSLHPGFYFGGHNPLVIGVAWFVPLDILFSTWVCTVLLQFQKALVLQWQWPSRSCAGSDMVYRLGQGGSAVLGLSVLWLSRHHIKEMLRALVSRVSSGDDSNEPMSHRTAVIGLITGIAYISVFYTVFFRTQFWVPIVSYLIMFTWVIGFARIRASVGTPTAQPPFIYDEPFSTMYGSGLTHYDRLAMSYHCTWSVTGLPSVLPMTLETYKVGDDSGMNRRALPWLMMVGVTVAMVAGVLALMPLIYEHGMSGDMSQKAVTPQYVTASYQGLLHYQMNPFDPIHFGLTIWGALITLALWVLRIRYVWWPLAPEGFVMSTSIWMGSAWGGFLIVWVIKALIFRYGGNALYKKIHPFFVGLVIGYALSVIVSGIIGLPPVW